MDSLNLVTAIRGLVSDGLYEIHTNLPVRVVSVDYSAKTVHVESLVNNTRSSDDSTTYPTMYDVPIVVNGGGTGRISMPTQVGDVGVVMFSERDPSNALQGDGSSASNGNLTMPCGIYPIGFIPKTALANDSTEDIDSDNVVISNNKQAYISVSPDGIITIESKLGGKITIDAGVTIEDSGGGILKQSGNSLSWVGGEVNFNGYIISASGVATDSSGVTSNEHTHVVEGVSTGSASVTSDAPTGE